MEESLHILTLLPLADRAADDALLAWTRRTGEALGARQVSVVHAFEPLDLPAEAIARYPWLQQPMAVQVETELRSRLASWDRGSLPEPGVSVAPGKALEHVLRESRARAVDLVVAPLPPVGDRSLAVRLARKVPCPVLLVPSGGDALSGRVLAATDGSPAAQEALSTASAWAKALDGGRLDVVLSYHVPRHIARSLLPPEELEADFARHARSRLDEAVAFLSGEGLDLRTFLERAPEPASGILSTARLEHSGLVVCGCRGRDTVASKLLGGTAEVIIERAEIPVLAVKAKGATLSLLDVLLGR